MTAMANLLGRSIPLSRIAIRDIWFVGTRGLFHLSPQTGQITRPSATIDRFAADYIHEDKASNLWMLVYSPVARLVKYDRQAERFTEYPFGEGAVGIPNSTILDDGQNGMWVASSQGLYHFDLQNGKVHVSISTR
jgi:ligand-binding sensor domain-containing protein